MDGFHDNQTEADRKLDEDLSRADNTAQEDTDAKFLARVECYRDEALDREDHREACVGAINAGLAEILHHSQKQINGVIEHYKGSLLDAPEFPKAVGAHVALARQWSGLLNFESRLQQIRAEAENVK